jgi:REP element-mobilizing transposase RayT
MARGNDGQKVFVGESDYQAFTEGLRNVRQRYPFSLYAYALMSNHFHLLLEVRRFPTARILQSLLTGYALRLFSRMARARFAAGRSQQRWSHACMRGHRLVSIVNAR